jgi:glycolate oxidase iron-sulfur subunit
MATTRTRGCALPDSPIAAAMEGIETCVHCGFCLQACPTYVNLQDENDSPRGRILLMRALAEGELTREDPTLHTHIDRCLGCRACETACPSGVPYGQLLELTRATINEKRPIPLVARVILGVFAREWLLRPALVLARIFRWTGIPALLQRLPGTIGFGMAMLASTRPKWSVKDYGPASTASGPRATVLRGCVMDGLFSHTNAATARVLARNGYSIVETGGQVCCGALHAHAGDLEGARRLARLNVAAFEQAGDAEIAVNAAGCGAMIKEYGHLLHDDTVWRDRAAAVSARARDVSELLASCGPEKGNPLNVEVTYDAPCHLLHAQRVVSPPLAVLNAIPGLKLVPLTDSDQCCGSAGIYNLIEPGTSDAVLAPKLEHIAAAAAPLVATGNPGCMMQIGAGLRRSGMDVEVVHPVDLLDRSYAAGAANSSRSRRGEQG